MLKIKPSKTKHTEAPKTHTPRKLRTKLRQKHVSVRHRPYHSTPRALNNNPFNPNERGRISIHDLPNNSISPRSHLMPRTVLLQTHPRSNTAPAHLLSSTKRTLFTTQRKPSFKAHTTAHIHTPHPSSSPTTSKLPTLPSCIGPAQTHTQLTTIFPHSSPQTTQLRSFLGHMFEKQRKMSWVLHRRKKMEMSADLLSRPTYRPNRTESMDLIQKRIQEITVGREGSKFEDFASKVDPRDKTGKTFRYDVKAGIINRDEVIVPMDELLLKEKIHVYILKIQYHSIFAALTYGGLWAAQYCQLMYKFKTQPEYVQKYMDVADMASLQLLHHAIDSSPDWQHAILAWGITSSTDLMRFSATLLLTALFWTKRGNKVGLPPEYYNKIKYRFGLEEPPPVEYDVSKIDPNLALGLVNLPGTDPVPRHDYYGRDRQRDLIPKDRIDLEYVLHSWQRTNAVRRRREALVRRRKPTKKKITGPRWAKVGQGMFSRQ